MRRINKIVKIVLIVIIVLILLLLIGAITLVTAPAGDLFLDFDPISYTINLPETLEGPLKVNSILDDAEILHRNILKGPESLALASNGDIYTGCSDGTIYRIRNDLIMNFTTLLKRPLGMRVDSRGDLYVIEPDTGIFRIDFFGRKHRVLGTNETGLEPQPKFFDDLDIEERANSGHVIYFSDMSAKYDLSFAFYGVTEPDRTGRIIRYDTESRNVTVLVDDLWFPNGVTLNDAKDAIIFCEFTKRRVLKHYIHGPLKGTTEVLAVDLPGEPDNIRRSLNQRETYWIGLAFGRDASRPTLMDKLSEYPLTRKFLFRATHLYGVIMKGFGSLFGSESLIEYGESWRNGHVFLYDIMHAYMGIGIEMDSYGNILTSLHSPSRNVASLSEIRETRNTIRERTLYLGSYSNPYLAKVTLKNYG